MSPKIGLGLSHRLVLINPPSSALYGIPESTPSHVLVDFSEILIPTFHLDGINQDQDSCPETEFLNFKEPKNRFQGNNSASLCSLAGRYYNPISTRFLAPTDCLKIPALFLRAML
jgi:hypothetical protein